jgi:RNA polymerase sigma-70 factor, ECF subfamily
VIISTVSLLSYMDSLYRYAIVLSRNPAVASDLVQETYVRALEYPEELRRGNSIKSWMLTILRNIRLNEVRRKKNPVESIGQHPVEAIEVANDSLDRPFLRLTRKVEVERVREAIDSLPDDLREMIVLREYEDLSYQEVAEVVGCQPEAVISSLAQARARLRALLADRGVKEEASTAVEFP